MDKMIEGILDNRLARRLSFEPPDFPSTQAPENKRQTGQTDQAADAVAAL